MIDPQHIEIAAAAMVRVYGRSATLACERLIDNSVQGNHNEVGGIWPKILEAVCKQQSLPSG
ncbi:MAG TPA: hypothetical protein VNW15_00060 [Rhizomicrobium sp.]|jgi:hypothetical protein|nr:hypothetical protein [Rhizomicrobium sp.]